MKKVQAGDHVIIEYEGMLEDDVIVESSSDTSPCEFEVGIKGMTYSDVASKIVELGLRRVDAATKK